MKNVLDICPLLLEAPQSDVCQQKNLGSVMMKLGIKSRMHLMETNVHQLLQRLLLL